MNLEYVYSCHFVAFLKMEKPMSNIKKCRQLKSSRRSRPREQWHSFPTPRIVTEQTFEQEIEELMASLTLSGKGLGHGLRSNAPNRPCVGGTKD